MPSSFTTFFADLKALPRPVWVLCVGTFLNKFGAFVIPFLALYLTRRGFAMSDAGLAIGAYGLGHLLASGVGGYLADRIGRRPTIVISMLSAAVSMLLLSQADDFGVILGLVGLTGFVSELYRPACTALIADVVAPEKRVVAFSAYRWALNAGWAFGPATAGFLAKHSFFWLFVGDAISSALFGLVAWAALPAGFRVSRQEAGWATAVRLMCRDRRFLEMLAATLAIGLVFMQMSSTFGLHVTHAGLSPAVYGALISLNGLLVVLFELPLTTITQRFPPRRVIALGYALIGIGFGLNAVAHSIPSLLFVIVVFTVGEMISMPVSSAYVAGLAPPAYRGRYAGVLGFTWATSLIVGPAAGMAFFEQHPGTFWIVCGACGLLASMIVVRNHFPQLQPIEAQKVISGK